MKDLKSTSPDRLLSMAERGDHPTRRAVVDELVRRGTDPSIAALVHMLECESWHLREQAVRALAQVGSPASPRLLPLLKSGLWYSRAAAARALGRVGASDSLPDLVALLADSNKTVQGACLASIADLVRAGHAQETARLLWSQGARRADELKKLLLAVHADAGRPVAELLADPSSFLKTVEERPSALPEDSSSDEDAGETRKNA